MSVSGFALPLADGMMMPPLGQAGALLSSPIGAGCSAMTKQPWAGFVLSPWSILLTLRNRKRPQHRDAMHPARLSSSCHDNIGQRLQRIQAGATSDVMGTSNAYT